MSVLVVKVFFDTLYAVLPPEAIRSPYITVIIGITVSSAVIAFAMLLLLVYGCTAGRNGTNKQRMKGD